MNKLLLIDKENNLNHANLAFRKLKKRKEEQRPGTTTLLATFNPLPKINQISIPALKIHTRPPIDQEDMLS